ncbi:unnamed protein product [Cladocopium goreaui]|uniref:Phosphodiesterase n=1 Tax=Cladocopium goreaui TaxID=2562237 RepID=A0A9P1FYV3_9DINO|nr:unnamed protein product [Cladocopium goreaui]
MDYKTLHGQFPPWPSDPLDSMYVILMQLPIGVWIPMRHLFAVCSVFGLPRVQTFAYVESWVCLSVVEFSSDQLFVRIPVNSSCLQKDQCSERFQFLKPAPRAVIDLDLENDALSDVEMSPVHHDDSPHHIRDKSESHKRHLGMSLDEFLRQEDEALADILGIPSSVTCGAEIATSSSSSARLVSFPTDEEIHSMLREEEQRTIEVEALSTDPEEVVSDYKPTKFGRCTTCQYSRKPHLFQSGANAGHIRLVCSQWWKLIDGKRQCWTSAPLSDDLWPKIPKYLKNQHAKLRASLLRNGATLVKKLKGQLKSKSSRLEPKHPDARLHVRAGTKWQKEARKAYSKSPKSEKQPRRIDSSFDWSVSSSDEAALDWLCDHGFLQKPKTCPDCSAKTLGGPWKLDQRQDRRPWWFWRCKAWNCQRRKALFFNSRFEGLKVTPAELAYMIMSYISAVWNQCISIAHFVQLTGLGYSSCRHFLDIMSEREAFAGKALSMSAKVTKCIEADGTSVGRFWVKRSNKTYADQIYQLENREGLLAQKPSTASALETQSKRVLGNAADDLTDVALADLAKAIAEAIHAETAEQEIEEAQELLQMLRAQYLMQLLETAVESEDMTELHAMLQAVEGCPDPFSRAVRYQLMLRNALSSLGAVQVQGSAGDLPTRKAEDALGSDPKLPNLALDNRESDSADGNSSSSHMDESDESSIAAARSRLAEIPVEIQLGQRACSMKEFKKEGGLQSLQPQFSGKNDTAILGALMQTSYLGLRMRRFKSLRDVVRKVTYDMRIKRILETWTEVTNPRKNSTEMKPEPLQFDPLITKNQMDVWDGVDVLDLDKKCSEPLFQVFMTIWYSQKMSLLVKAKTEKVQEYVRAVEAGYHRQNPYHNNSHAAEVTLMTYQIWTYLSAGSFKGYFEQVDLLVVLLAAAIHDIGHPATNNDFLVKTKAELALRYHDTAVLENFHLATAFQLMRSRSISMLDHNLPSPPVTSLRRRIVEIVLATDMAVHKKQVDDMARSVERHTNRQEIDKRMLEQYIVHTADVGHPFRPVPQHQEWARRVNEEFLQQGDREKELGFTPIEMFDREKAPPLPKNQLGFLQFVIQPLWKPMEALLATLIAGKFRIQMLHVRPENRTSKTQVFSSSTF